MVHHGVPWAVRKKFDAALLRIPPFLDATEQRIFTRGQFEKVVQQHRDEWALPKSVSIGEVIERLREHGLVQHAFEFPSRTDKRLTWRQVPILEVINSLLPGSYFSHYTALSAHGLTEQLPKSIYLNKEQVARSNPSAQLTQARIDMAMSRPQRQSSSVARYGEFIVCELHGQNTGNLGVVRARVTDIIAYETADVHVTNLERTLIDAAVRPNYCGGIAEVIKAYDAAKSSLSTNRLVSYLRQLGFVYPYHQAIGYYLDVSGAGKGVAMQELREIPMKFDFYLAYGMSEMTYVPRWRLYVPKGFDTLG